jgi:hypothetical protein
VNSISSGLDSLKQIFSGQKTNLLDLIFFQIMFGEIEGRRNFRCVIYGRRLKSLPAAPVPGPRQAGAASKFRRLRCELPILTVFPEPAEI